MGTANVGNGSGGVIRRASREAGAALVEFAVVAPLLILLIFGIVEFGWLFAQMNEIRHVAQEGARWGAVSWPDGVDAGSDVSWSDLHDRACGAANLPGTTTVSVDGSPGAGTKGATASISVTATVQPLTGIPIITTFLPTTLTNTATFRLERAAEWAAPLASEDCP